VYAFVQLITFTTFTVYSDVGAHGSTSLATGSRVALLCLPCLLSEEMEGSDEVGYTNTILKMRHRTRVTHGAQGNVYRFWSGNMKKTRLSRTGV